MEATRSRFAAFLFVQICTVVAIPAQAFVDPPTFEPPEPLAGQSVQMSVRAGECHGFFAPPPGQEFLEVAVDGTIIDVIISGQEIEDPLWCIVPIGTLTVDIGSFPQGEYVVRVRIREVVPPFSVLPPASEAPLTIRGFEPRAVPLLGMGGWVTLALALVVIAVLCGRAIKAVAVMAAT
jgi:hypothetical protein